MAETLIIAAILYLVGFTLSHTMLRIEHEAEKQVYTQGHRLFTLLLSLLSWGMVLFQLVAAWYKMIHKSGYWSRPVKTKTE